MKFWLLAITALVVAPQAERITIRVAPSPNQVVRMRASQEVTMTGEPEDAAGGTPATPGMAMAMTSSFDYTMTVGQPNEQGRYEARIVCDSADATMTLNGQAMPIPLSQTAGAVFTIVYDADGRSVDIAGGSEAGATWSVRQFLQGVLGESTTLTLAVGETVTRPMTLSIPIPGPASLSSDVTVAAAYTLQSVTSVGGARIAHLTTSSAATFTPKSAGASPVTMGMKMSGEGTADMNLDLGLSTASVQVMTIDGVMTPGSSGPALSSIRMRGTVKTSSRIID